MSEDNQQLDENVQETTLDETRESEDTSEDLESLFGDDSQEEAPVSREEFNRLLKGVKKLASDKGREKVETKPTEEVKEVKSGTSSVIKNLYFKANPEAQEIWEEVEKEAKLLGKDPFELYEGSSYLKGEAKARAEAKAEEEKNKSKIAKPSTQTGSSQEDISKVKPEDVEKLTPAQKVAWIKEQSRREKLREE